VMPQLAFDVEDTDVSLGLEVDWQEPSITRVATCTNRLFIVSVNVNPKINFYDDDYKG
jgi:hypothetical protein